SCLSYSNFDLTLIDVIFKIGSLESIHRLLSLGLLVVFFNKVTYHSNPGNNLHYSLLARLDCIYSQEQQLDCCMFICYEIKPSFVLKCFYTYIWVICVFIVVGCFFLGGEGVGG
ncbi:hypothetical protein EGW08_004531, partial [Elysia chlorotica]